MRGASLLLVGLALGGCLEEGHGGFLDAGAAAPADLGTADAAGPRAVYPTAGLGTGVGDVLADAEFLDADGQPFALRDVFFDEAERVMLVSTAAGWCAACIEEQPKLNALHAEYGERGLFVLVAFFEDSSFAAADVRDAARWRDRHDLALRVVADTEGAFGAYYDTALAPMTMLVEVPTMRILSIQTGFDEAMVRAVIASRLGGDR
ncbi:MAG: TlpA family protein disulfide reductase [Myxococcales bacterium]|nr:TlpA family protein disulfide reductase [Myxococcales bacterium]